MMHSTLIKVFLGLSMVLSSFPILSFGLRSAVSGAWIAFGLYNFVSLRHKLSASALKEIGLFSLPYLLLVFSLLYSEDLSAGVGLLERMLSFMLFPIVVLLNKEVFTTATIKNCVYVFIGAVFLLVCYQWIFVFYHNDFLFGNITTEELKANGFESIASLSQEKIEQIKVRRFRNFVIDLTRSHTAYQGLWIVFSLYFLSTEFRNIKHKFFKYSLIFVAVLLLSWLLMIAPRMPIVAGIFSMGIVYFILSELSIKMKFGLISAIVLGFSILLAFKNPVSVRFQEYFNTGFSILKNENNVANYNSANVRNGIYYCGFDIAAQNFLIGVGIGDVQNSLDTCYAEELSSKVYSWHVYNSHNQYLFFVLCSGIVGLLSFLWLLYSIFRRAILKKDRLLLFTLSLLSFTFLTENLLERSDGVMFIGLFVSLFFIGKKD